MSYTQFKLGYAKETTFRSSAITAVGDTAYLLGAISDESDHPSPTADLIRRAPGYNSHEVTDVVKGNFTLRGMYGIRVQNGILLWMALGTSSTGAGPPYTHTIGPATDGSALPSFTFNLEQEGSATDEEYQFQGVKVDSLMLSHNLNEPHGLAARLVVVAGKATDGIALTTSPALPPTANANAYVNLERKWDVTGTPVNITGLEKVEIQIGNVLNPVRADTWDAGTYTGMWVQEFIERPLKSYRVNLQLHPTTIERKMWDDLIGTGVSKQMTFKWYRSATDYILVTVTGPIIQHDLKTPKTGEHLLETVVMEPHTMAVSVVDAIAGGYYGE